MTDVRSIGQRLGQSGITLVELVIVMALTTAVTLTVLSFAIDFWGSNATLQSDLDTYVTRSNAGDSLREQLNVSSGLITQNSLADSYPHVPDPSDSTGQYWDIIHAIPGTTNIGSSGTYTPIIYWQAPATDDDKNILFNGDQPYENEFILYLNGTTKELLLRRLANPNAIDNSTKTTCPAASSSVSCPADRVVADNVSSVATRYFSRSGNLLDYTSITDPITGDYIGPDFTSVEVVELTLNLYKKSTINGGQDTINSTIIRVAIRNR